jgi:hypothetical protein
VAEAPPPVLRLGNKEYDMERKSVIAASLDQKFKGANLKWPGACFASDSAACSPLRVNRELGCGGEAINRKLYTWARMDITRPPELSHGKKQGETRIFFAGLISGGGRSELITAVTEKAYLRSFLIMTIYFCA